MNFLDLGNRMNYDLARVQVGYDKIRKIAMYHDSFSSNHTIYSCKIALEKNKKDIRVLKNIIDNRGISFKWKAYF